MTLAMSWTRVLGILCGALSLYSLLQRMLELPLSEFFKRIIAYYRRIFYPFLNILQILTHIQFNNDIAILYVVLGFAYARSFVKGEGIIDPPNKPGIIGFFVTFAIWPLLLFMAFLLVILPEDKE